MVDQADDMRPRASMALVVALMAGAVAAHWNAIRAPFFADDFLFLEQVRGRSLWTAIMSPDPIGNFLRPVSRQLWFWLLSNLGGESPAVFHAVNLALFLCLLWLLYRLALRVAGEAVAIFAVAFVAFHYAADVPLMWASGSQDLLAAVAALAALSLHVRGQRLWAAGVLAVGLLSKEGIVLVPLIAMLADMKVDESWRGAARRAWPLFLVTAVWAVVWIATVKSRPAAASVMEANVMALPATLWHMVQVAAGAEAGRTGFGLGVGSVIAVVVAGVAVYLAHLGS